MFSFDEKVQYVIHFVSFPIWLSLSHDESVLRTNGMFLKTSISLRKWVQFKGELNIIRLINKF